MAIKDIMMMMMVICGWIFTIWMAKSKDKNTAAKEVLVRLDIIEKQILVMDVKVRPFWETLQTKLVKDLTHPHPQFKKMDELLVRLEDLTITVEERKELLVLIEERIVSTDPLVSQSEKASAQLIKIAMVMVLAEAEIVAQHIESETIKAAPAIPGEKENRI